MQNICKNVLEPTSPGYAVDVKCCKNVLVDFSHVFIAHAHAETVVSEVLDFDNVRAWIQGSRFPVKVENFDDRKAV